MEGVGSEVLRVGSGGRGATPGDVSGEFTRLFSWSFYGYLASQYRFDGSLWVPSYYQQDALGSTVQLTGANEDVTDSLDL